MMDLHPFRSWQIARLFARQFKARFLPQTQHLSDCVNRLNAGGVSILIKIGIARNLNCIHQAERAVRVMFFGDPALEKVVAVTHAAATFESCGRQVSSQTRKRSNELACRSRRTRATCSIYQGT